MPEGDTIFKTAATLQRALQGKVVVSAEAASPKRLGRWPIGRIVGSTVEAVEPRGKHLVIRFSNQLVLHTHMQMAGSWHIYRPGERWQRPAYQARVVLRTDDFEAVCFSAPTVELLHVSEEKDHTSLANLGPDPLAADFDPHEARRRLRALPDVEIGAALLDQQALAGPGNVYKSEALFLCNMNPFTRVADLGDAELDRLVKQTRRLMRGNVTTTRRVTTGVERPGAELWVYGRQGRPCRRCGTRIQMERQRGRSTYWCPSCQV